MAIRIFIDQGHNPVNPNAGAEGFGLREQDITYDIGTRLANLLRADPNFEVKTSRTTPTEQLGTSNSTSLATRVNSAIGWGANYFISLHTNASLNPNIGGTEGYAYSMHSEGYWLGEEIIDSISDFTGIENKGMFVRPSLYVLRRTPMPAVLIEMAYITNENEAYLLSKQPQTFADAIYEGLLSYFGLNM